jgi:hypothetical protein
VVNVFAFAYALGFEQKTAELFALGVPRRFASSTFPTLLLAGVLLLVVAAVVVR